MIDSGRKARYTYRWVRLSGITWKGWGMFSHFAERSLAGHPPNQLLSTCTEIIASISTAHFWFPEISEEYGKIEKEILYFVRWQTQDSRPPRHAPILLVVISKIAIHNAEYSFFCNARATLHHHFDAGLSSSCHYLDVRICRKILSSGRVSSSSTQIITGAP